MALLLHNHFFLMGALEPWLDLALMACKACLRAGGVGGHGGDTSAGIIIRPYETGVGGPYETGRPLGDTKSEEE